MTRILLFCPYPGSINKSKKLKSSKMNFFITGSRLDGFRTEGNKKRRKVKAGNLRRRARISGGKSASSARKAKEIPGGNACAFKQLDDVCHPYHAWDAKKVSSKRLTDIARLSQARSPKRAALCYRRKFQPIEIRNMRLRASPPFAASLISLTPILYRASSPRPKPKS